MPFGLATKYLALWPKQKAEDGERYEDERHKLDAQAKAAKGRDADGQEA